MVRFIKRIAGLLALAVLLLALLNWKLIAYGIRQAKGQLSIMWNARPIDEIMSDPEVPDTLKKKLELIGEIRRFAIDSLGLRDTESYRKLYDQKGKPVLWVVTASEPYALEAKTWDFPIIGSVPYKGFFDKEEAEREAFELERKDYDVRIQNPGGWSTLGWFNDPVLSGMLERDEGDLASLIIHEMVHATIFVKDSVTFNENLASFIGDRGAEAFLRYRYGRRGDVYVNYLNTIRDFYHFANHILRGADALDSLYKAQAGDRDIAMKSYFKQKLIRQIVETIDTLSLTAGTGYASLFREKLPNNAYFLAYRRYMAEQDELEKIWSSVHHGNLVAMLNHFKDKYGIEKKDEEPD